MKSFVALISICIVQWSVATGCSERDRLVRDLTKNYLTSVEPDATSMKAGVALLCSRYERDSGQLISNLWERFAWTDLRLRWDPKDYDGIEVLRLPSKLIWTPDFKLYNSLKSVEDRDQTHAVVGHDGSIIWIPTNTYRTLCTNEETGRGLKCQFALGPWTYDANILKLEPYGSGIDISSYYNSTCPLLVQKTSASVETKYYPCCKEPYSTLVINITLQPR